MVVGCDRCAVNLFFFLLLSVFSRFLKSSRWHSHPVDEEVPLAVDAVALEEAVVVSEVIVVAVVVVEVCDNPFNSEL